MDFSFDASIQKIDAYQSGFQSDSYQKSDFSFRQIDSSQNQSEFQSASNDAGHLSHNTTQHQPPYKRQRGILHARCGQAEKALLGAIEAEDVYAPDPVQTVDPAREGGDHGRRYGKRGV